MDVTASGTNRLVLVVEDDLGSRRAMTMLFRRHGWTVNAVATMAEAKASLPSRPTCLILDLALPDGSGIDVLRHVRENNLPIRVAVVTGIDEPVTLRRVTELSPDAFFPKPIDVDELINWFSSQSDERSGILQQSRELAIQDNGLASPRGSAN